MKEHGCQGVASALGRLRFVDTTRGLAVTFARAGQFDEADSAWSGCVYESDGGIRVTASHDNTPHGVLLHVSISRKDRNPTWGEIKAVREAFYSAECDVMMVLPKRDDYINVHTYCFHLWQTPTAWGVR